MNSNPVSKPVCVLADEPTGNLDPHNAEKVLQLFFDLQKVHQTSVVMVTHDPNIARRAQRTLQIVESKLIEIMKSDNRKVEYTCYPSDYGFGNWNKP